MESIGNLPPTNQLDLVLSSLLLKDYPCYSAAVISSLLASQVTATPKEIEEILVEILKDGYASNDKGLLKGSLINGENVSTLDGNYYFITFSGKAFLQKGGYAEALRDAESLKKRVWALDKKMYRATLLLACATACLFLFEIVKFYFDHPCLFRHCCDCH